MVELYKNLVLKLAAIAGFITLILVLTVMFISYNVGKHNHNTVPPVPAISTPEPAVCEGNNKVRHADLVSMILAKHFGKNLRNLNNASLYISNAIQVANMVYGTNCSLKYPSTPGE